MKAVLRQKTFIVAFFITYFLFFIVTVYVLDLKTDGVGVGNLNHGFPFAYYHSSCFGGYYDWFGLAGNIATAGGIAFVFGVSCSFLQTQVFPRIWAYVSSPEFRRKWRF